MKNIYVLPTDKPSRLFYNVGGALLFKNYENHNGVNIYITSDEEIKEDYVIAYGFVIKVMMFEEETLYFVNGTKAKREDCKKIILTTDQDLINAGVQAIDDEFLEWFVKNPSCEEIEVKIMFNVVQFTSREFIYKIIIPKEEAKQEIPQIGTKEFNNLASAYFGGKPKQYLEKEMFDLEQELDILSHLRWHNSKPKQETLEEFIKRQLSLGKYQDQESAIKYLIELGAKWQAERMYSEEEVELITNEMVNWAIDNIGNPNPQSGKKFDEVLNKFKNK